MDISYNWLKDLIDIDLSPDDTAKELTRVGLAVEGVHKHGDDHVLDIDLTSNRPDCLSHLGVARELHAITGRELAAQKHVLDADSQRSGDVDGGLVTIDDPDLCPRFTARIIRGVKVGPSPEWLAQRLEAVGERSINNVADITNYVMLELGQPMHAFDLDKLAEMRIVVRRARPGENITTLDEVDRKLDESMLSICDAEKPIAVAGVMGGLGSSITESTRDVLLEVAYFDRANIRRTSRKLSLSTEASHRFERGVDIDMLRRASDRASSLIVELAGGEPDDFVDVYPRPREERTVISRDIAGAVRRLAGLDVSTADAIRSLDLLGISSPAIEDGSLRFASPSWRHDIAIEEDLVEEVARLVGYENIKEELPPAYGAGEYQPDEPRKRLLRQRLADLGFDEVISYSFIDTTHDERFASAPGAAGHGLITLKDSVIEGAVRMRPTLLPGVLDAVRANLNFQRRDLRLFEIGKAFSASESATELPHERELLCLVVTGTDLSEGRSAAGRELDLYDAKGAIEAALETLGVANAAFKARDVSHFRPGQSAVIEINGTAIGTLGRLSDGVAAAYKFRSPMYIAELDMDAVCSSEQTLVIYRPLPRFPSITRDVSLLAGRSTAFSDITAAIDASGPKLCRKVDFVDVFEGTGVPDGMRSLTLRFEYRHDDRTLIDDEVAAEHRRILDHLASELGTTVRS